MAPNRDRKPSISNDRSNNSRVVKATATTSDKSHGTGRNQRTHKANIHEKDTPKQVEEEKSDTEDEIDDILTQFSPEDLNRHGYIDHVPQPMPAISPAFVPSTTNEPKSPDVHSIFAKTNWPGTDDEIWNILQPSLQVATRLLGEPALHHYFHSLIFGPHDKIADKEVILRLGQTVKRFGHVRQEDLIKSGQWQSATDTWKEISNMSGKVVWLWGDNWSHDYREGTHGVTSPNLTLAGLRGG